MLTVYDPVFSFTQFLLDSPLLQQPVSHPSAVLQDRTRVSALLCQRRSPLSVVGRGGERWHTLRNGPLPLSAHLLTTRPLHGSFSDPHHTLGVGPARVSCAYGCAVCQRSSQRWPRDARLPTAPHSSPRLPSAPARTWDLPLLVQHRPGQPPPLCTDWAAVFKSDLSNPTLYPFLNFSYSLAYTGFPIFQHSSERNYLCSFSVLPGNLRL